MPMHVLVIQFSGSTCDRDLVNAMRNVMGWNVDFVWYQEAQNIIENYDAIFLPGGFAYGDYLRAGIIAAFTPVMKKVKEIAKEGIPVLGICNGFQILVESELLPGALIGNETLRFSCKWTNLRVETTRSSATNIAKKGDVWKIPIAHGEGRYYLDKVGLKQLNENDQVVWRYVNDEGETTKEANPNGSIENIAGICNLEGNIVGLMPHPERAAENIISPFNTDHGKSYFHSIENFFRRK
ncbi:MAG TPA: phosphoribosylformylglycinamidine synthase I [candidate division Zixibacteria bacterium]|nr:phosphoribosylformylglycinamidine synthase I [candidate division Zixibacteria bacterium]